MARKPPSLGIIRKRLRAARTHDVSMLDCPHTDSADEPTLRTTGAGVFCSQCGMLLTWEELAEYMRGNRCDI